MIFLRESFNCAEGFSFYFTFFYKKFKLSLHESDICVIIDKKYRKGNEKMYGTAWALLPPLIAIVLALITKEAYSSLFIGVVAGGLLYAEFNPEITMTHVIEDGLISVLSDPSNVGIIIFLVILGSMVSMMNRAGGSAAFGRWAQKHIKTRVGAQLATVALGVLIFIDDYFNCLTVGSVMKPVADKYKISKEKLSYIIDATAAPVCIIAPISSWAAAVTGFVEGEDGLSIFIRAIPYNYYAIFTIVFMVAMIITKTEFGSMKKYEYEAMIVEVTDDNDDTVKDDGLKKGGVIDLVFPIVVLIAACVLGMIYTGDFFKGESFVNAFANSDASVGLVIGSLCAMLITIAFYSIRRVIRFKDCVECIPSGFQAMIPAILILTLAWTLKAMTDSLGAKVFVSEFVRTYAKSFTAMLPAIIFIVGALLAFATGTSWGTFGILIPIVVNIFQDTDPVLMIISISACMAGAVCGDHCSPISDTTIMASAGAECEHINHVSTQIPYVIVVAVISCLTYVVAGLCKNVVLPMVFGLVLIAGFIMFVKYIGKSEEK